jgi:hypothetical protein
MLFPLTFMLLAGVALGATVLFLVRPPEVVTREVELPVFVPTPVYPDTAAGVLDVIDRLLASGFRPNAGHAPGSPAFESRALWDVLSALRGPDSNDVAVKARTTEVIRTRAFPCTALTRCGPADFAPPGNPLLVDTSGLSYFDHFRMHAVFADAALRAMGR